MTASLLEMNEKKTDLDNKKQKEIDLLLNRTDWAKRAVAPVVRAELGDDFLKSKLTKFQVGSREVEFRIGGQEHGPHLARYSSTIKTRTINGRALDEHMRWATHHGHQDLYSYTVYVKLPYNSTKHEHLFFTVAAVDNTTSVAGCDKISRVYDFGFVVAACKRSNANECHFKNAKWIPWPKPEANLAEWLKTQISVHFQCFLEEGAGDDMYLARDTSDVLDFNFPEWSDV